MLLSQSVPLAPLQALMAREFPDASLQSFTELRKALNFIKKSKPQLVIAEFLYAPTYGSQLSNFEALCATLQRHSPRSQLIALVAHPDHQHIERLNRNVEIHAELTLPLNLDALAETIRKLQIQATH